MVQAVLSLKRHLAFNDLSLALLFVSHFIKSVSVVSDFINCLSTRDSLHVMLIILKRCLPSCKVYSPTIPVSISLHTWKTSNYLLHIIFILQDLIVVCLGLSMAKSRILRRMYQCTLLRPLDDEDDRQKIQVLSL